MQGIHGHQPIFSHIEVLVFFLDFFCPSYFKMSIFQYYCEVQTWPVHPVPHVLTLCRNTESSNPFGAETVDCNIKNSIVQRNIENNFGFLLPFIFLFRGRFSSHNPVWPHTCRSLVQPPKCNATICCHVGYLLCLARK